jgi:diadenosine tetraphosphatase ApaH/serine/threonine PP2A family protein phosphatase
MEPFGCGGISGEASPANLRAVRVVVLSDIHSNAPALEAVLEAVSPWDRLWVLGDIVGYGPDPDAVVARLREENAVAVQGNHDAAAVGSLSTHMFNDMAKAAVEWTAETISGDTRSWLSSLPQQRIEAGFTLVHGSPRDPLWEYVFSVAVARASFEVLETDRCLVGHTHHQLTFRHDGTDVEGLSASDGARLVLDDRRCILNPGSVGQPRDGDPRACAMSIDTESGEVEWQRVEYPIKKTQRSIRDRGLPQALADRLELGV